MVLRDSEILEKLREKGSRIVSFRDLVRKLNVREKDEDELRERLEALERRGDVARVRGEKYSAIEFTNQVAGRITVRPEGFGFVLVKDGPDLYVPRTGMHGAMDGDTVLAREDRTRSRGRSGSPDRIAGTVVKVLDRAREPDAGSWFRTTRGSTQSSGSPTGELTERARARSSKCT